VRYVKGFPNTTHSVAAVRRFVAESFEGAPDDVIDAVVLMASEVAANVVRHVGVPYTVEVRRTPEASEVRVTDGGGGRPSLRFPAPSESGGRGMMIVDALSDRWGADVDTAIGETTVWFEVSHPEGIRVTGR
jgi:anti-sigma regulatory factor (Ser/Thr protein kinase)